MEYTEYAASRFRGVTHARWALVFDQLGIDWLYAVEAPDWLPHRDLAPTFYLPSRKTWFRVAAADELRVWHDYFDEQEDLIEHTDDDEAPVDVPENIGPVESEQYLVSFSGIPDPATMGPSGPSDYSETGSMILLTSSGGTDEGYQWTRCGECGYVGAEFSGRAERLPCRCVSDDYKDYRSNDPGLLDAYRLARRSLRAKWHGAECGRCGQKVAHGALIISHRRTWMHAHCAIDPRATIDNR